MARDFQYHYSPNRKKWAVAVVVIILAAAGFALFLAVPPAEQPEQAPAEQPPAEEAQQNVTQNETQAPAEQPEQAPANETVQNATQNITAPPAQPPAGNGLSAEYFTTTGLAGDVVARKVVPALDFAWSDENQPADGVAWNRFSARFSGILRIGTAGDYTFILTSDDGSRLFIDSTSVADIWENTGTSSKSAFRTFSEGDHAIKVEYRNIGGGAAKLKLEYWSSRLNISRQVIPTEKLAP